MAARQLAAAAAVALLTAVPAAEMRAASAVPGRTAATAEARQVAATFFRTLNARRYDRTCASLADAYFDGNPGSERRTCAVALRTSFMWAQEFRWRITGVDVTPGRVLVDTVVDGAPGTLVLVREGSRLRIATLASRPS
jgi:hypothetical protein